MHNNFAYSETQTDNQSEIAQISTCISRCDVQDYRRFAQKRLCHTAYSAVFASPSRVKLAAACGLAFQVSQAEMDSGVLETRTRCLQHRAGKFADEATLIAATELGLPLDSTCIATGAAESGDLAKLQMLHRKHACKLDCTVRLQYCGNAAQQVRPMQQSAAL
eukprot:20698-Heterococcus_DN1.PRE.2